MQITDEMVRVAAEAMKQQRRDEIERGINRATYDEMAKLALTAALNAMWRLRPEDEWHEDMGDVLWWRVKNGKIIETPWVGSPLCCGVTVEAHTTTRIITQINQEHDPEPTIHRMSVGGWIEDYYTHFSALPSPPAGEK